MSAPVKLLFLHGYTQSGTLFHAKTKALEKIVLKTLPTGSSLHFPTAPHQLKLSDLPGSRPPGATELELDASGDNWTWWRRNVATDEYTGLDETWIFLSAYLTEHGPFDGCVGFSQGAALAALLVAALEPGRPTPAALTTAHPPLKFGVAYSGFRAPARYECFYDPLITTPILHFLGSLDTVVEEARSMALVRACVDGEKRVVFHPGGHYLPAGRQYVNVLLGFMLECVDPGRARGEGGEVEAEVLF